MDVWISIKGMQEADGERNSLELSTVGKLEKTTDGYKLTYEESETTGMEGVTTTLLVKPSAVTLERRGTMNSLFVLEEGRRMMCNYDTGYGNLTMGIYARSIHSSLADKGGSLDFHYTMDINSSMTSSHDVYITVRETPPADSVN